MKINITCSEKVKDWISTHGHQRGHTMPCLFIVFLCFNTVCGFPSPHVLTMIGCSFDSEYLFS